MAARKSGRNSDGRVTAAKLRELEADIARLRAADDELRRECATNLRRCAELQRDIDRLLKALKSPG